MSARTLGLATALIFVGAAAAAPAHAQTGAKPPTAAVEAMQPAGTAGDRIMVRRGDGAQLSGRNAEMAFVTGRRAMITGQVADDIFASGRPFDLPARY